MHAVIVTVDMSASDAELESFFKSYSRSLVSYRGLLSHLWLRDTRGVTLFHVFETEDSAKSYLDGGLPSMLTAHPACTGHAFVRRFDVIGAGDGAEFGDPSASEMILGIDSASHAEPAQV